jgi:hypothetical protein
MLDTGESDRVRKLIRQLFAIMGETNCAGELTNKAQIERITRIRSRSVFSARSEMTGRIRFSL